MIVMEQMICPVTGAMVGVPDGQAEAYIAAGYKPAPKKPAAARGKEK